MFLYHEDTEDTEFLFFPLCVVRYPPGRPSRSPPQPGRGIDADDDGSGGRCGNSVPRPVSLAAPPRCDPGRVNCQCAGWWVSRTRSGPEAKDLSLLHGQVGMAHGQYIDSGRPIYPVSPPT